MCGIFGIIRHRAGSFSGETAEQVSRLLRTLAVASAARGTDATGLAVILTDGTVTLYKDVVDSYTLVQSEHWSTLLHALESEDVFAILGHTRHKTTGANSKDNAHPFLFQVKNDTKEWPVVGMHNGTIHNHKQFGPENKFDVDSANFLHSLAHAASLDEWPKLLESASGNFAIALASLHGVVLARNDGSPCYVMSATSPAMTVFASTDHALAAAESLSGIAFGKIRALAPGKIAVFTQGRKKPFATAFDFSAPSKSAKSDSLSVPVRPVSGAPYTHMCTACFRLMALPGNHKHAAGPVCDECYHKHLKQQVKGLLPARTADWFQPR